MKAAVITAFGQAPRYTDFPEPVAGPGQLALDVLAVGLHHITRGRASGAHYSGGGPLPLVAGIDGVGRGADGQLRYFVQSPEGGGTLAERCVIDPARSIVLPDGVDPVLVAAAMNPAMAAWLALRRRAAFRPGQSVLIVGATGSSGRMAVQIAHHLGAARIIATGRDPERLAQLASLGADNAVSLTDERLGILAAEVDVVLDFVWGEEAPRIMEALLRRREDRAAPLTWIHVGSMAGDVAAIPGALLRGADLRILGSGLGSVSGRAILQDLPALVDLIAGGELRIDSRSVPLSDIAQAWEQSARSHQRIVVTP